MKQKKINYIVIILLLITINFNSYSDDFYYYKGNKINLQQVPNKYYLQMEDTVGIEPLNELYCNLKNK